MEHKKDAIEQIREFNRFYTVLLGLLNADYLQSGYSVTETRILFEIYRKQPVSANSLIRLLLLDKSYISRLIRNFESKGLIHRSVAAEDGRKRMIELTASGETEIKRLIEITNTRIAELIEPLPEESLSAICHSMQNIIEGFTLNTEDMKHE